MQGIMTGFSNFCTVNFNLLTFVYLFVLLIIGGYITEKTRRIYKLTSHKGILIFHNSFLFFTAAFFVQLIAMILPFFHIGGMYHLVRIILEIFFYQSLTLGGLYIVRSLIWKDSSYNKELIFHIGSFVIALVSVFIWSDFVFVLQIILFLYAASIAKYNLTKSDSKHKKRKGMYFYALSLAFITYSLNYLVSAVFNGMIILTIVTYIFTITVFGLFAHEVGVNLKFK